MVPGPLDDLSRPCNDRPLHNLNPCVYHPDSSTQTDWAGSSCSCGDVGIYLDTGRHQICSQLAISYGLSLTSLSHESK